MLSMRDAAPARATEVLINERRDSRETAMMKAALLVDGEGHAILPAESGAGQSGSENRHKAGRRHQPLWDQHPLASAGIACLLRLLLPDLEHAKVAQLGPPFLDQLRCDIVK